MDGTILSAKFNVTSYRYNPTGVCAKRMNVTLSGDTIIEAEIIGGCSGNSKAVTSLITGMTVDQAIKKLKGIKCGEKPTSCPDQLATAIEEAYALYLRNEARVNGDTII